MELSKKQITSFFDSDAKINIWEGSVRSGKTYVSLWRFLKELKDGPEGVYALICYTFDAFTRNVLPELQRMIGKHMTWYPGKRQMVINNKTIHVIGASDESAAAKIQGPTFRGAYVDEVSIIPESAWKMLISRCMMGGARIFATCNPDSPYHWLKKEFLEGNPDVKSWKFVLDDNPQLTKEEKDYIKRQYHGMWYQRYILGEWALAQGAVYDCFDPKFHCIDETPSYAKRYYVGIDYGINNPFAMVLVGFNDDFPTKLWVQKEYYYDSKNELRQKTDFDYANDLENFIADWPVDRIYVDPSALSFITECKKRRLRVFPANNDVDNGIRFVSQALSGGDLKILKSCTNLIDEFYSYVWDDKAQNRGIDKPKKQSDHALDALRYVIYTKWGHLGKFSEMTADERERAGLERLKPKNPMDQLGWGVGWQRVGMGGT